MLAKPRAEIVDALDQQQLLESSRLLERALRIHPDAPELVELTARLDEKIARQVDRFLADGNELYRGGSFERAKQIWETALELDPENVAVRAQVERVQALRERRDSARCREALDALEATARSEENLVPAIVDAVLAWATVGVIAGRLREVFGEHQETLVL